MQKKFKILVATAIVGVVSATGVLAATGVIPNPKSVPPVTAEQEAAGRAIIGDTPAARAAGKPGPHVENNNPIPTYKANAASTSLVDKDAALALNQPATANSSLISIELVTWGAHMLADDNNPGRSGEIEAGRMVWVEKLAVPDGYQCRGGIYDNATVILTRDAETGNLFESSVHGKLRSGTAPTHGAPVQP